MINIKEKKTESHQKRRLIRDVILLTLSAGLVLVGTMLAKYLLIESIPITAVLWQKFGSVGASYMVVLGFFALYVYRSKYRAKARQKLALILTLIVTFNIVAVLMDIYTFFAVPVVLGSLTIAILIDPELVMMTSIVNYVVFFFTFVIKFAPNATMLAILIGFTLSGVLMTSIITFFIARAITRLAVLFAGLVSNVAVFAITAMIMAALGERMPDFIRALPMLALGAGTGLLGALLFQPIFEQLFNVLTNLKLMEITDHRRPLLKRLQEVAPGTFHHSLTVANLAETCASAIGENIYLARAAAYYHDVGKIKAPLYFKENQNNYNPHDELTPEVSVGYISRHTAAGYALAKEYKIPEEIARITLEHHGTLPITYFYYKAQEMTDAKLDINEYRYPGPIPSGKIAAIIMICDACEAAVRSLSVQNAQTIDKLVLALIDERLKNGQFDNCDLTMRDIHKIRETIVTAFVAVYHHRIEYPK